MSESGENSNTWHTNAIKLFEQNDIGWCWWTYKKMGFNCVMEIPTNSEYEKIKAYWKGEGTKPTSDEAYKGLMQLAYDYKVENTLFKGRVYRNDGVDIMPSDDPQSNGYCLFSIESLDLCTCKSIRSI